MRCHKVCAKSLVVAQKSGAHSEADYGLCKFLRREESKPVNLLDKLRLNGDKETYSHSTMKRPGDLVIRLKSRTTAQDLREPELANGASHVLNFALRRRSGLDPL